jgi:hypothetical protein
VAQARTPQWTQLRWWRSTRWSPTGTRRAHTSEREKQRAQALVGDAALDLLLALLAHARDLPVACTDALRQDTLTMAVCACAYASGCGNCPAAGSSSAHQEDHASLAPPALRSTERSETVQSVFERRLLGGGLSERPARPAPHGQTDG